ncbi:DUF2975 domain-containing protein [Streptomyces sp. NPDC090108]|uniref:DUF2975 domain-containing protein n=1 Tax=Streptomyces sp. NPDC090108 TaxID=3365947 RepID=UPI0037FB52F8
MGVKHWWNRTDSRLLEVLLGLAVLLDAVFGVVLPVLGVTGLIDPVANREVEVGTVSRLTGTVSDPAGHGMTLNGTRRAELVLAHPDLGQRVLLVLPDVIGSLFLLLVLILLFQMARTLRGGDVFVPRNARRLTVIGLTVLVQAVLSPVLPTLTTALLVRNTAVAERIPFTITFSGEYILLALLLLALSEVFRRGARLRADTEGLV